MIDFETVLKHFGPQAVTLQLSEAKIDLLALQIIKNKPDRAQSSADRVAAIRNWLRLYEVFQGIDNHKRTAIAECVLPWADSQTEEDNTETIGALVETHKMLMDKCCLAFGTDRDFTSLASKAMWLRYPHSVPLFDSFAQRALWVISKFERDIAPSPQEKSEYCKFALAWKTLYDRIRHMDTSFRRRNWQS
jgi:hypothetical protein